MQGWRARLACASSSAGSRRDLELYDAPRDNDIPGRIDASARDAANCCCLSDRRVGDGATMPCSFMMRAISAATSCSYATLDDIARRVFASARESVKQRRSQNKIKKAWPTLCPGRAGYPGTRPAGCDAPNILRTS